MRVHALVDHAVEDAPHAVEIEIAGRGERRRRDRRDAGQRLRRGRGHRRVSGRMGGERDRRPSRQFKARRQRRAFSDTLRDPPSPHHPLRDAHEIPDAARHRPRGLPDLPRHHDLRRAEHRSRGARATRSGRRARHQLHRHRRDVSGAAERGDVRAHRDLSSATGCAGRPRGERRHRDQGRRTGAPSVGPRRPHRPHPPPSSPRRPRRASRACAPTTSTSTRSTGRSATCRTSARPNSTRRRNATGRRSTSRSRAWRR